MGGFFGGGGQSSSKPPVVQQAQAPVVAATAPPPEDVAEAPVINEGNKRKNQVAANRKGTSALRINLSLGGGETGGGNGVSIPR